jgi:hypothetical protein
MDEADPLASESRTDALAALWFDYDQAYVIEVTKAGEWRWRRRDGLGGWTTANGPDELRQEVREDYDLKPVPRPERPRAGLSLPSSDVAGP